MKNNFVLLRLAEKEDIQKAVLNGKRERTTDIVKEGGMWKYFSYRYGACTDRQKSILRDYLQNILQEEDGFLILRSPATCLKIWWERQSAVEQHELCDMLPEKKKHGMKSIY